MCSDELEAASPAKFLTVTKGLLVLPALPAATAAQREGCVLELSVWVCNRSVQPNGFFSNAQIIPNV